MLWSTLDSSTSPLSAARALIRFLHGLTFPSPWSGSAQCLSPAWQQSAQIEEPHSSEVLPQSLSSRWHTDSCNSSAGSTSSELISWFKWYEMHLVVHAVAHSCTQMHFESLPCQWLAMGFRANQVQNTDLFRIQTCVHVSCDTVTKCYRSTHTETINPHTTAFVCCCPKSGHLTGASVQLLVVIFHLSVLVSFPHQPTVAIAVETVCRACRAEQWL